MGMIEEIQMSKHQKTPVEGIAIAVAVAGAFKDCPDCHGKAWIGPPCETCKGTGKELALDPLGTIGVRRGCPDDDCQHGILTADDLPFSKQGTAHKFCQGRGWVPTNDAWMLLTCLPNLCGVAFRFYPGGAECILSVQDEAGVNECVGWAKASYEGEAIKLAKDALLDALSKELVGSGYTLGE